MIDGELKAMPRALFLASSSIKGNGHSIGMKDSELKEVKENIEKYFLKMEKKSPFQQSFSPFIDKFEHVKDLSDFMKSWGFSNNETNSLISSVKRISRNESSKARNEQETLEVMNFLKELKKKQKEIKT